MKGIKNVVQQKIAIIKNMGMKRFESIKIFNFMQNRKRIPEYLCLLSRS